MAPAMPLLRDSTPLAVASMLSSPPEIPKPKHAAVRLWDAGLDDDFLSDRDIDFDNQVFSEFAGLPANGTFFLRVEDRLPGDTGTLDVLDIEVEYLLPIE